MKLHPLRSGLVFLFLALPALAPNPATAQGQPSGQPPAVRIRGIVESFSAPTLTVKTPDGKDVSVTIPADLKIMANAKTSLADIKPGDFVGSAANVGPDGKLYAEEVHVFAESQRGAGEGHRPMAPDPNRSNANPASAPERSMTNGTVTASAPSERSMTNGTVSGVSGSGSRTLKITYKDGVQEIIVSPDTPIITNIVADASLLKPGSTVAIMATQTDSGLVARGVTAEKDGVIPR